jgi:CO/xanthine dehydrogenase Mo-binding subunit
VFEERVTVSVQADGVIEVFSAVNQMGQGIATTLAQLVVDVFGVPIDKVRVVLGDTDRGDGFGSAGSRSLFTGGSAAAPRRGEDAGQGARAGRAGAGGRTRRPHLRRGASPWPAPTSASTCSKLAGKQPDSASSPTTPAPWPARAGPTAAT